MWFFSANEAQFLFTVDGCHEELGVLRFSGQEALGSDYLFEIDVVCDSDSLDLLALQHQTACLILQNNPTPRYIHGIVLCAGHIKTDPVIITTAFISCHKQSCFSTESISVSSRTNQ